jgi:hypothetical protein
MRERKHKLVSINSTNTIRDEISQCYQPNVMCIIKCLLFEQFDTFELCFLWLLNIALFVIPYMARTNGCSKTMIDLDHDKGVFRWSFCIQMYDQHSFRHRLL